MYKLGYGYMYSQKCCNQQFCNTALPTSACTIHPRDKILETKLLTACLYASLLGCLNADVFLCPLSIFYWLIFLYWFIKTFVITKLYNFCYISDIFFSHLFICFLYSYTLCYADIITYSNVQINPFLVLSFW